MVPNKLKNRSYQEGRGGGQLSFIGIKISGKKFLDKLVQNWSYQNIWSQMGTVPQMIMWRMTVLSVQSSTGGAFFLH